MSEIHCCNKAIFNLFFIYLELSLIYSLETSVIILFFQKYINFMTFLDQIHLQIHWNLN